MRGIGHLLAHVFRETFVLHVAIARWLCSYENTTQVRDGKHKEAKGERTYKAKKQGPKGRLPTRVRREHR